MPRAGWAGGMLRAPKLYQSVSISGPSATSNPMPTKTSSRASWVWETRWRWPRAAGAGTRPGMNSVRSIRLSAISRASSSAGDLGPPVLDAALDGGAGLVQPPAELLAGVGLEGAEAARRLGQGRLLAGDRGGHLADLLGRVGRGDGRPGLLDQGVDVERASVMVGARPPARPPARPAPSGRSPVTASMPEHRRAHAGGFRDWPSGATVGAAQAALAQGLEAQHGGRHAHVERLGPADHRDGHPVVEPARSAARPARTPRCRTPGPPAGASRTRRSRPRPGPRCPRS